MIYARLAMAIDCDGSLTAPDGNPLIQVTNSSLLLMDWLKETFGGEYYVDISNNKRNPRAKIMYHWQADAATRTILLTEMLPFFVVKKQQARVCLELLKMVRKRGLSFTQPLTNVEVLLRHKYGETLHELNA